VNYRPADSDRVSGMPRKTPPRAKPHAGALSRSPAPRTAQAEGRVPSRTPPKAPHRSQSPSAPKRSHQRKDCGGERSGSGRSADVVRTGTRVSADRFARSTSPTDPAVQRRRREALAVARLRQFAQVAAQQDSEIRRETEFETRSARPIAWCTPSEHSEHALQQALKERGHEMISLKLQEWALKQVQLRSFS